MLSKPHVRRVRPKRKFLTGGQLTDAIKFQTLVTKELLGAPVPELNKNVCFTRKFNMFPSLLTVCTEWSSLKYLTQSNLAGSTIRKILDCLGTIEIATGLKLKQSKWFTDIKGRNLV